MFSFIFRNSMLTHVTLASMASKTGTWAEGYWRFPATITGNRYGILLCYTASISLAILNENAPVGPAFSKAFLLQE
jgi:hypothetical protein